MSNKRILGQYWTTGKVFNSDPLQRWVSTIPNWKNETLLEPFAGEKHLLNWFPDHKWSCFDIQPTSSDIICQDTILNFPKGYRVCITNPPYLAKNSAKRRKMVSIPKHEDLYLDALEKCLDNCDWVSVIIPSSFISLPLFKKRCFAIDKLDYRAFADTDVPVCVAYFTPDNREFPLAFVNGDQVQLNRHIIPRDVPKICAFNVSNGEYVLNAVDTSRHRISISKETGKFNREKYLKHTSRNYCLFTSNKEFCLNDVNDHIESWRKETKDYFLTSFKSPSSGQDSYRKRISFGQLEWIITQCNKAKII